jgi:hypothetical protein
MHGTSEPHARHDRHLVAALAADDLEPIVRTEAETLVATCRDCAELFADLKVIALATAALPDVPRMRDFRITAADAARLRPRGWRALVDAIGGARATFTRPLATGLTTLGIVGLLITTVPGALGSISFSTGSSAGAPQAAAPDASRYGLNDASAAPASMAAVFGGGVDSASGAPLAAASAAAPSAAATAGIAQGNTDTPPPLPTRDSVQAVGSATPGTGGPVAIPPPGTKGGRGTGVGVTESGGATTDQSTGDLRYSSTTAAGGPSPLLPISIVCLMAGLGLFAARWGARRLARL